MKNFPYPIYAENLQGENTGDETAATIGDVIDSADEKTTPVDADLFAVADSAASFSLVKVTWANIKATIKAYIESVGLVVLKIIGTAGAGYINFPTQSSNPTTPASGTVNLFAASAASGVTRLEMQTSTGAVLAIFRDTVDTIRNVSGSQINKGQVVYITGSNGTTPTVGLAKADAYLTSNVVGIAVANIANNAFGTIQKEGVFTGVDTTAFTSGDILWLSSATAGSLTNVEPAAPSFGMKFGTVITSSANGQINIMIQPFVPQRNYASFGATNAGATTVTTLVGTDTTDATSSTAAGTKFASGLAVAKKINVGTDAAVGGNLTVTGTASGIGIESVIAPTLLNSWVNYGAPFATAAYWKDAFGIVHLRGIIKSGTAAGLFVLPSGYRPTSSLIFPAYANTAFGYVLIDSSGNVSGTGSNAAFSLDGITFRTT